MDLDDSYGFVRADCGVCGNPDVWLTCQACKRSDRFQKLAGHVRCHCGATYDHASCTCGQVVPYAHLLWVDYQRGPLALTDWEVDRRRVAVVVAGVVVAVVGVGVAVLHFWR